MADASVKKPADVPVKKTSAPDDLRPLAVLAGLLVVLIASYWNTLADTWNIWGSNSGKYSHGYLIPIFTLVLLFIRYRPIRFSEVTASARWAGLALLAIGLGVRVLCTYSPHAVLEMYSFVPSVAGLFLMVGGWPTARWAGPAVLFLIFMFPLPAQLDKNLLAPLQRVATASSTYCLQTMGFAAYHEGNRIVVNDIPLGVEEQCSGLRMLNIFIAISVALVIIIELRPWQIVVILLSSVPIAVAVNIARITITGVLYVIADHGYLDKKMVDDIFHMMAGWFMPPMALGLLYIELQILFHLFIDEDTAPVPFGMQVRPPGAPI
jgi:exosortase